MVMSRFLSRRCLVIALFVGGFSLLPTSHSVVVAETATVLPTPPQNEGLPYTRSARAFALKKIQGEIAVFAGSRYAYVQGYKVRLDESQWRGPEARLHDGEILVPASFAGALELEHAAPAPAPAYLAERWVYTLQLPHRNGEPVDLAALARAKGLKVYQNKRGLLLIGKREISFGPNEAALEDSVITLFDTPEKFADPDIATRYIATLARQGKMSTHVKVTAAQLAMLNGPETVWPTAPKESYDFKGFNQALLGSKVPPPGVYPRLLFSPEDVPMLAQRVKSSRLGQMSLIEMEYLLKHAWWDPSTNDGQIFLKLSKGDTTGLVFDEKPGESPTAMSLLFKGEKPTNFSSHVAYIPEGLTAMSLYCLLTNDDVHGRQAAVAIATFYKLLEPKIDAVNAISDSEFGSSLTQPDGTVVPMNGNASVTHFRTMAGLVAHMNLGLSLDLSGKWMSAADKDPMRRIIAKVCYGRRSYAQDGPVRFRDVNWMGWDLTDFIANQEIEGLEGFDPEVSESGMESVRAFCDWGIDDAGVVYESNGKTPGSFQFITLSMVAAARRGQNYFGHPHLRKLLTGQVEMTSPNGRVTVNSGTQYVPYSQQMFSFQTTDELKAFFPEDRRPDYLLERGELYGGAKDEANREWALDELSLKAFKANVSQVKRLRMPDLTYPGFVHGVLYDTDFVPTTRADLDLPLDFNAPTHGVFSSYSDRSTDAAWINMMVRPDHYLGAGHHHADAGMFHFSALGVDWFTQSPFAGEYDGRYYNLVQVDGHSEAETVPGVISGYNAAAKYLGASTGGTATAATADLTYAYTWRWQTQPQQIWPAAADNMGWELDPSPELEKIFAGTARYKMREWFPSYTFENYIATSRALFNPMEYVYRTTGLVRGAHPYGYVVDDLKKDERTHLYRWVAILNGGVWKANVSGLAANMTALAFRTQSDDAVRFSSIASARPSIDPRAGDPLLLVCVLNLKGSSQAGLPLLSVDTLAGAKDRQGAVLAYDRLSIDSNAAEGEFKVLLLPYRAGDPLPKVSYDASAQKTLVMWPGQTDEFDFTTDETHRTHVTVRRGGTVLVESK
jgi:hypothetical protein